MPAPSWAAHGVALYVFLFFVVFTRAQGTYWLGRAVPAGVLRASSRHGVAGRLAHWFEGPTPRRGAALLDRWGLIIIPLCFLTVGIQTAVNAGSGVVRLRWRTYTLAMIPGCIVWALMYGLGAMAVWLTILKAAAGSPWAWLAIGVAAVAIAWAFARHRRSRRVALPAKDAASCDETADERARG